MPQHHVHISTEFLFVLALLFIGLAWVIGWAVTTSRRDRRAAERAWQPPQHSMSMYASRADYDTARRSTPPVGYTSGGYVQPAPTVVHSGGSTDLLTGVLIGEALSGGHSHHDTTVTYVDSSPSYSPSSDSSSSGFSYSDSSSSYSDSGSSSGGFDASW